ncbi:hypothetical protein SE92_16575 [Bradyrhizobium sp. AT1]|uniref:hypothetical protein n=1 Tax=Bradyrhizobium sp. AT1 TaxID=574934 RepID=UPI000792B825|nr:hypothetical protein [Bradyrhizobium sp. AT1]KYG21670.1 hypothetical protein SE92_16575 [Bradyrhizobium sp. AT1]
MSIKATGMFRGRSYHGVIQRPIQSASVSVGKYLVVMAVLLYVSVSASLMRTVGWHYGGGGSSIEKLHPGTYLLVFALAWIAFLEKHFALVALRTFFRDYALVSFTVCAASTAAFCVLVKEYPVTPFIETFGVTIIVFLIFSLLGEEELKVFKFFVDTFVILNIALIFVEYLTQRNFLPAYIYSAASGTEQPVEIGRPAGLFGLPLSAAAFLCLYSLVNLIPSIGGQHRGLLRPLLGVISLMAAAMTGARAALLGSIAAVLIPLAYAFAMSFIRGVSLRAAIVVLMMALVALIALVIASENGLFDLLLARFESDRDSALSRYFALQILINMPSEYVWTGGPADYITQQQQVYNVLAIEISWVNFVLACGLAFTIPLILTYLLFLFRSVAKHAVFGFVPSIYVVIVHASALALWSKSTSFAASIAVVLAYIGRKGGLRGAG